MHLSYWEYKSWFSKIDYTIVGSGIVGLSTAIRLKEKYPDKKVVVLEKGLLPQGASTKNAGFACFGSLSEILDDLGSHSEDEVLELVEKRWKGLHLLRTRLGDNAIDYQNHGGYELFTVDQKSMFLDCLFHRARINEMLMPIFGEEVFVAKTNSLGFEKIQSQYIFNQKEGQIDTGKMMQQLLYQAQLAGVIILNSIQVKHYEEKDQWVEVHTDRLHFVTKNLCIATNGFAGELLEANVQAARAQVLITKPIPNLNLQGTFHLDQGYYYFRNIHNRILFGGGRNLDFKGETTTTFGLTDPIQHQLEYLLTTTILPQTPFEVESRWSGIMGVGQKKKAIVKRISPRVSCGIRLGGMGVAIGSLVGTELADLN
ncbi:MAG: FAD-binding oxidoreductase [Flavobacteriaceae bacterium]|nr:FAD-binding oxidoreductase [Flavobacteriaceae bacterium]